MILAHILLQLYSNFHNIFLSKPRPVKWLLPIRFSEHNFICISHLFHTINTTPLLPIPMAVLPEERRCVSLADAVVIGNSIAMASILMCVLHH